MLQRTGICQGIGITNRLIVNDCTDSELDDFSAYRPGYFRHGNNLGRHVTWRRVATYRATDFVTQVVVEMRVTA